MPARPESGFVLLNRPEFAGRQKCITRTHWNTNDATNPLEQGQGVEVNRLLVKTLDWEEIREFLVRRKSLRELVGEDNYKAIFDRRTKHLTGMLMHEMSIFIDGYHHGRGTSRGQNTR